MYKFMKINLPPLVFSKTEIYSIVYSYTIYIHCIYINPVSLRYATGWIDTFIYCNMITLVFTWCPFSILWSHLGHNIAFSCRVSLATSWLWQFPRLSLFLMTQQFRGVLVKCFVGYLFIGIFLMLFLWLDHGDGFWFCHIILEAHAVVIIDDFWCGLNHLAQVISLRFFHCECILPQPLSIWHFGGMSLSVAHTSGVESYALPAWR